MTTHDNYPDLPDPLTGELRGSASTEAKKLLAELAANPNMDAEKRDSLCGQVFDLLKGVRDDEVFILPHSRRRELAGARLQLLHAERDYYEHGTNDITKILRDYYVVAGLFARYGIQDTVQALQVKACEIILSLLSIDNVQSCTFLSDLRTITREIADGEIQWPVYLHLAYEFIEQTLEKAAGRAT